MIWKRNKLAYLSGKVSWLAMTIVGVYQLWQVSGMTYANILFLQGLFALFVILLEYPSGIIADRTSRKNLLIIANIAIAMGSLIYSVAHTFDLFVLAEFAYAIGFASISGADNAFIWDSALELRSEEDATKLLASGNQFMMFSAVIMMVLGGYLAVISLQLVFYISALGSAVAAGIYFRAHEPTRAKTDKSSVILRQSLAKLKDRRVMQVLGLVIILGLSLRVAFWGYIPKMQKYDVDPVYFGYVLAGANLIAAFSVQLVRNSKSISSMEIMIYSTVSLIGVYLFVVDTSLIVVLIAISFHQIARGTIRTIQAVQINKAVKSEIRASIASLISTIVSGLYLLFTVIVEWKQFSLDDTMLLITLVTIGIVLLITLLSISISKLNNKKLN